jgi:hypothetical protein
MITLAQPSLRGRPAVEGGADEALCSAIIGEGQLLCLLSVADSAPTKFDNEMAKKIAECRDPVAPVDGELGCASLSRLPDRCFLGA